MTPTNPPDDPPDTKPLKPVYYWLDGYWITDKEEADLMDEINAFGSTHGVAYFPLDADPALIDTEITALLATTTAHH